LLRVNVLMISLLRFRSVPAELTVGRVLGRGGFCVVNEINNISLNDSLLEQNQLDAMAPAAASSLSQLNLSSSSSSMNHSHSQHHLADEDHIHNIVQDRAFMEKFCIRKGKDTRYAIKRLQQTSFKDAQTFVNGIVDLAIEARFLAIVRHPNIVKMRAMRVGSPFADGTFFVVLDRLYDILTQRVLKWNKQQFTGVRKVLDRGGKKEMAFWVERITVAYDLACALKYLHDMKYVKRKARWPCTQCVAQQMRGNRRLSMRRQWA
jgi:serine/threonine protein kinase